MLKGMKGGPNGILVAKMQSGPCQLHSLFLVVGVTKALTCVPGTWHPHDPEVGPSDCLGHYRRVR